MLARCTSRKLILGLVRPRGSFVSRPWGSAATRPRFARCYAAATGDAAGAGAEPVPTGKRSLPSMPSLLLYAAAAACLVGTVAYGLESRSMADNDAFVAYALNYDDDYAGVRPAPTVLLPTALFAFIKNYFTFPQEVRGHLLTALRLSRYTLNPSAEDLERAAEAFAAAYAAAVATSPARPDLIYGIAAAAADFHTECFKKHTDDDSQSLAKSIHSSAIGRWLAAALEAAATPEAASAIIARMAQAATDKGDAEGARRRYAQLMALVFAHPHALETARRDGIPGPAAPSSPPSASAPKGGEGYARRGLGVDLDVAEASTELLGMYYDTIGEAPNVAAVVREAFLRAAPAEYVARNALCRVSLIYNNLASSLVRMAEAEKARGDASSSNLVLQSALYRLQVAERLFDSRTPQKNIPCEDCKLVVFNNLGLINEMLGKNVAAKKYYTQAIKKARQFHDVPRRRMIQDGLERIKKLEEVEDTKTDISANG